MSDNGPSSSVRDAVRSRHSVRAFLGDAVPTETLREVLQAAARRFRVGGRMYALLNIPREDKAAWRRCFANSYTFFGAPAAMICSVDRRMGPPQWSDLGEFLPTVMLLLRERRLDSFAQEPGGFIRRRSVECAGHGARRWTSGHASTARER